ncbi:MAG: hypothetical protein R2932_49350 [Caldilineaceae bacterium]
MGIDFDTGSLRRRSSARALRLNKHVFLYSDNVSVEDERALKQAAAEKGCLSWGRIVARRLSMAWGWALPTACAGNIGVVGASGTGLQQVTARIHQLGGGITHALGTGGRDLSEAVGAITAKQSLDLLASDDATQVIVLISKPPAATVIDELLRVAGCVNKPVIIDFIGYRPTESQRGNVYFVKTLDEAATSPLNWPRLKPANTLPLRIHRPHSRITRGPLGRASHPTTSAVSSPAAPSPTKPNSSFKSTCPQSMPTHRSINASNSKATVSREHDCRSRRR